MLNFLKNNWLLILFVILLGYLVISKIFERDSEQGMIPAETVFMLDSLRKAETGLLIENAGLKAENNILKMQVQTLEQQASEIHPKYVRILREYSNSSQEQKNLLVKAEYEKRKKERELEK